MIEGNYRGNAAAQIPVKRMPQITEHFNVLEKVIAEASEKLSELETRLNPVVTNKCPLPADKNATIGEPKLQAPMVETIMADTRRVMDLTERMQSILDRLEI